MTTYTPRHHHDGTNWRAEVWRDGDLTPWFRQSTFTRWGAWWLSRKRARQFRRQSTGRK